MFCIKMSKDSRVTCVYQFRTEEARHNWLLEHGFVDNCDVWYHPFSKHVAGVFSLKVGEVFETCREYKTCDQRLSPRVRAKHGS